MGDLSAGWPEYEWRTRCREFVPRHLSAPVWDGQPLAGRTILLYAEQGLGDTLHFVRYASLVKGLGGQVIVECQRPLLRILASCPGIDQLVAKGALLPAHDVRTSLLSLPAILRTTPATIPANVPYLAADEKLVEHWRRRLSALDGFRVGIAWKGDSKHKMDRYRSIPLAEFERLAEMDGVRLISLQKGPGSEQIRELAGRFEVTDWTMELDEGSAPFMDTAALMRSLELVVAADTSAGHLAGALGVSVWLALPFAADWRWQLEREDTPWYPTMRLFRQSRAVSGATSSSAWRGN